MTHAEKFAAYNMADAYARVRRGRQYGAQSVGAVNLAAGLQDAYLGCSPVIALNAACAILRFLYAYRGSRLL